ncbi:MAG: siroheme synthase CysG [Proteobacteria bacterium]|nr:siroheme synthase CysG [Pseudomonadota bacterium]MDA0895967.1 siroheme synthase CysG [Pseudomonadota bacterium]MDA1245616.1 siroheme synthase CysG [Pseudomonadota bacterium]
MERLPLFFDVKGKRCVVVGGGEVALRKATLLARAGAKLHIVAPELDDEMASLCKREGAFVCPIEFQPCCLASATLVIAATDSLDVNTAVSDAAKALSIPVNVVDQPALCTFIVPAIVDRSPILVAISSGGASPILARSIKRLIETLLPARVDRLALLLRQLRDAIKGKIRGFDDRTRFWEKVLEGDIPELVYAGKEDEARKRILDEAKRASAARGEVYLVGAGPGDPELLTLKALRLMHKADVVLFDRLVSESILLKLRPDADKIFVGKQKSDHAVPQETINEMLVRLAREGKKVLRLKGGDPFIFGRGGEEIESLAAAGVDFQVVPGITAASGCATYAGIPLTHRDYSQSVRFLTGHIREGGVPLDWAMLAGEQQTLAFYMGLSGLQIICDELLAHGMDPSMPVAVIEQGTTREQKVSVANLVSIREQILVDEIKPPTLIIVGRVVSLREKLDWFRAP